MVQSNDPISREVATVTLADAFVPSADRIAALVDFPVAELPNLPGVTPSGESIAEGPIQLNLDDQTIFDTVVALPIDTVVQLVEVPQDPVGVSPGGVPVVSGQSDTEPSIGQLLSSSQIEFNGTRGDSITDSPLDDPELKSGSDSGSLSGPLVPEPGALSLLALGAMFITRRRR